MAPRSLFFMAIAIVSAVMGASLAVTKRFDPAGTAPVMQAVQQPAAVAVAPAAPQPVASPVFAPPTAVAVTNPAPPSADSEDELIQVRNQIRRAIRERNTVLLRSLLQAGSVREMLRTVATPEQMNLDNLDASTWRILEQAIAHRCRQSQPTPGEASPEICFE